MTQFIQCYIHISFSAENNGNLYVQFSNCSRSILAIHNDQQLFMWDRICIHINLHDVGGIHVRIIIRCPCSGKKVQREDTQNNLRN